MMRISFLWGIPDMLYEEDMEADYIDLPRNHMIQVPTAGDIEEEGNVYDEYLGDRVCILTSVLTVAPEKGDHKEVLKGEDGCTIGWGTSQPIP